MVSNRHRGESLSVFSSVECPAMPFRKTSGSGHRPWRLFGIPPPAAVEAHILKDDDARLQIDRRFGSKTALASLTMLYVGCPLGRHKFTFC